MSVRLTVLGSGTSHGIPMIGCDCAVCRSDDPRDRRTRTSVVFSYDGYHLLVDTPPELRLQCVACGIRRVDAIVFTHCHADHIAGLDDVRRFNWIQGGSITLYGDALTLACVRQMFSYAFVEDPDYPSAKPELDTVVLDGPLELGGRRVVPIPLRHGALPVLGFRVGDIAYCTDCNFIPDGSRELLRDLDILILDAVRRRPHATHFNIAQAVEQACQIGARRTYFTHIAHELKHAETNAELPAGMELAYDGLVCESA
jgi:phosphoribosyl 1,2-cyclic phosphate phosphodiesterase